MEVQWEAAPLFAIPVFKLRISEVDFYTKFFQEKIQNRIFSEKDEKGQLSHYFSRTNVFSEFSKLSDLETELTQKGNFVYKELMNYKKSGALRITNAWFNHCELGGSQSPHNHVNCLLCGTFYLRADQNTHLRFYHPLSNPSAHSELYDAPDTEPNVHGLRFHYREAKIKVSNGDCLFWPSFLRHGYQNNETPGRLTLSFNMMPDRLNVDYQL